MNVTDLFHWHSSTERDNEAQLLHPQPLVLHKLVSLRFGGFGFKVKSFVLCTVVIVVCVEVFGLGCKGLVFV
jgi:hypothetical protein